MEARGVALVTGAGRNLGRAIALELARSGHDVAINVRSERAEGEAVAAEIRAVGRRAVVVCANVGDAAAVSAMCVEVASTLGPIAILVNNAGPRGEVPFAELTPSVWEAVVGPILNGTFYCC